MKLLVVIVAYAGLCSAQLFPAAGFIKENCPIKEDHNIGRRYEFALIIQNHCFSSLYEHVNLLPLLFGTCDSWMNAVGLSCLSKEGQDYIRRIEKARRESYIAVGDISLDKLFNSSTKARLQLCFRETEEIKTDAVTAACSYYTNLESCIVNVAENTGPNATDFVTKLITPIKNALCSSQTAFQKENVKEQSLDILESSKYGLMSLIPTRTRVAREIGGMGSKLPHLETRFKELCQNDREFERELGSMKTCLRAKRMFETPRDEFIKHIDDCSKETRKTLKQCLPEKLRYFPEFCIKLIESIVKLLYNDFGEIARGLSPCMSKLERYESEEDYDNCVARVGSTVDNETLESKSKFCEKFTEVSKCFVKQLNDTCTSNSDLEKFKKDYLRAVKEPCQ